MGRPRTLPDADCITCGARFRTRAWKCPATGARRLTEYCSNACSYPGRTKPPEVRFWRHVDKRGPDECWLWTGGTTKGYAVFDAGPKNRIGYASRYVWSLANERPFPTELLACHTCDNPICVNPAHIYPGTPQQNSDDRVNRGRALRGSKNPVSKLTEEDIPKIRDMVKVGVIHERVAAHFGVTRKAVSAIINGATWKHVSY